MPTGVYPRKKLDPLARFEPKWLISPSHSYAGTPCWEWEASIDKNGYAQFRLDSKIIGGHRWSYEHYKGAILPEGSPLDHLCRVRHCVNPDHLEMVTFKENALRGKGPTAVNARKTHCKNGHPFDKIDSKGGRACTQCTRKWHQDYYVRNGDKVRKRSRDYHHANKET